MLDLHCYDIASLDVVTKTELLGFEKTVSVLQSGAIVARNLIFS